MKNKNKSWLDENGLSIIYGMIYGVMTVLSILCISGIIFFIWFCFNHFK